MGSMYDILVEGVKCKPFGRIQLEYPEDSIFKEYGMFLDNIPNIHKKSVANEILKILYEYNRSVAKYAKHDEINEEREEHGLKPIKRKKNETYNKINKDLNIALNFRKTLESFEEMKKRKERISVLDTYATHLPPYLQKQADFLIEMRKPFINIEVKEEELPRILSDPYYRMVQLVDEYIQDLSNYTMLNEELNMAKMDKYIDSYPKPNRGKLRKYLLEVCKTFGLKNCDNNVKKLIKELNINS